MVREDLCEAAKPGEPNWDSLRTGISRLSFETLSQAVIPETEKSVSQVGRYRGNTLCAGLSGEL